MSLKSIGLIGIGLLGSAIAERLLARGWRVIGFDRDPAPMEMLSTRGGVPVESAAAVFRRCDQVMLALPDADIVRNLLEEEVASELRAGQFVIDSSTGAPHVVAALGERLAKKGVTYLDATVAASSEQMRNSEAVLLIGGPPDAVQAPSALWEALAAKWFHVGPCGSGASMKLVSNLVMGLNRAALAEGLALARASGLDMELTLNVLRDGNAYSRVLDLKGQKMISRDFTPQARLSQHLKDVELIKALAAQVKARTPLSDAHAAILQRAVEMGLGDLDNSALIAAIESPQV